MSTQFICDVCGATNSRSETYGPEHPYRYLHVPAASTVTVHLTVTAKVDPGEDVCGACVLRAIEGLIKCMVNPPPADAFELEEQLTSIATTFPADMGTPLLPTELLGGEYAAPDSPGREGPDPDMQPVSPPLEGTGTRSDGVPRPYPQNPEHYHFYSIHPDGKEWSHWHDHACPIEGCYYYECAPKDKGDVYHLTRYLTPAER